MRPVFLALLTAVTVAQAQTYLTGEMSGSLGPGTYIVTGTIYVLRGQTLKILPGTFLYFDQFSGITVLGTLFSEGSLDSPVVMTSIREREDTAIRQRSEAFDWNGIEITTEASYVEFRNTRIRHSVYGFNIKNNQTNIKLERVEFYNNGYASVVREGNMVEVQQNVPFSITWNIGSDVGSRERMVIRNEEEHGGRPAAPPPAPRTAPPRAGRDVAKPLLLAGGGAAVVTGGVLFVVQTVAYRRNRDYYEMQTTPQGAQYHRTQMESSSTWRWIGAALAGAGVVGATVTVLF